MTNLRKTIGIVAGAMKPMTAGHFHLVQKATTECDETMLFVSTGDRARPGEFPIYWKQMQQVWEKYLEPAVKSLGKVNIVYCVVPIRDVMEFLGEAEENPDNINTYIIYSDPEDLAANFDEDTLEEYFPNLFENGQICPWPVDRAETAGISGTKMREALAAGNVEVFMSGLPSAVKDDGIEIYHLLGGK